MTILKYQNAENDWKGRYTNQRQSGKYMASIIMRYKNTKYNRTHNWMTNLISKIWISIVKYLNFGTLLKIIYHINNLFRLQQHK